VRFTVARIIRSYEGVDAVILNKFNGLGYWPAMNLTACQPVCGVYDIVIAGDGDDVESKCVAVDARHFAVFDGDVRHSATCALRFFPDSAKWRTRIGAVPIAARNTLKRGRSLR